MNIVQGVTLVVLGVLIEGKEKRKKAFELINSFGKTAEKALNDIKQLSQGDDVDEQLQKDQYKYK